MTMITTGSLWITVAVFLTNTVWAAREKSVDNENFEEILFSPSMTIPPIDDVVSTKYGAPEYVCNKSDSKAWNIYCGGRLLHAVMMLHLYTDSKSFVDKPLNKDPAEVEKAFEKEFPGKITYADREKVRKFVHKHFQHVGEELNDCELTDWTEKPEKLMGIADQHLRNFALDIHKIWGNLCRQMKPEIKEHVERRSLIYVPNRFVVPGGRFREFYYWDTYWIVKGLIASGLYDTTREMLGNFEHMVKQFGFVPNGGRLYYLRRSQPPFFIPMIFEYYKATKDKKLLKRILPTAVKEMKFWLDRRSVNVKKLGGYKTYKVYQYRAESNIPRPESYREDFKTAVDVEPANKRKLWRDLASAAESGWDFSSRWFADHKHLSTINTTNIAPVDLNAILCWNMGILAFLHGELGDRKQRDHYRQMHTSFMDTFTEVFYDADEGAWYDFNIGKGFLNDVVFPTMAVPLFTRCFKRLDDEMGINVLKTLTRHGMMQFPAGIPTSLKKGTGQQWDYPNGWAPINHMMIEGLRHSGNAEMQQAAFDLATRWVSRNFHMYHTQDTMWEKYDVSKTFIKQAKGGEYSNQEGFGWTNGVALDLMVTYAQQMDVLPLATNDSKLFEFNESAGAQSMNTVIMSLTLLPLIVAFNNIVFV